MKAFIFFLNFSLFTFHFSFTHAQDSKSIADSNNVFAFDLYSHLRNDKNENLFFSPFSISSALAMTYAGARTETEKQMRNTLHFTANQNSFHAAYGNYLDAIESDSGTGLKLNIANSILEQENYGFSAEFMNILKSNYKTSIHRVDFTNPAKREQARKDINTWVEGKTNNKIKDLIAPGIFDALTRLVLVNAIYFNGKWTKKFDGKLTKQDTFHISSSIKVKAQFMHKTSEYSYYEDNRIKAIELPYADKKTSMLVLLPNEGNNLKTIESSINSAYYNRIESSLKEEKVELSLPKFKTTAQFELREVLGALGMPVAFGDGADFSGMDANSKPGLHITNVIHKAYIHVSEEGTEAAAATAVVMGLKAMGRPFPIVIFKADRPFIFVIKDNATGSILFMGEIKDPARE